MRWFKKRKLLFLPLPVWVVIIALLLIVGGIASARIIEQVTSETEVVEPLSVTDKVDFSTPIWPCTSTFLTFDVVNDAPVTYGLRLTPEDVTFPEGVHFGEVTVGGEPYTWGEAADIPPYETVAISIEVVADCDSELGTVEVTIAVERVAPGEPALPLIGYSPSSFNFTAEEDGDDPSDQTLSIWNAGGGTLNWSVSDDAAWLSLSPTSGTDTGTVTLSVDISGMSVGEYDADITITAPGATNTPQTVPVSLSITPPGVVTYDLTVISDSCCPIDVGAPINQTVAADDSQTFYAIPVDTTVVLNADDSDPCCDFVEWTGAIDLSGATNPNEVTMDDDKSVTAVCTWLDSDLTVQSIGCCLIDVKFDDVLITTVQPGGTEVFTDVPCCTDVDLIPVVPDMCICDGWEIDVIDGTPDYPCETQSFHMNGQDHTYVLYCHETGPPEPPVPPVCCWSIYYVEYFECGTAANPTPCDEVPVPGETEPTAVNYYATHCDEWLDPGHTETFPVPVGDFVIPDPCYESHTSFFDINWNPTIPLRWNQAFLEALVGMVDIGSWKSRIDLDTWKTVFEIALAPPLPSPTLAVYALSQGPPTPINGDPGWPYAVGDEWLSSVYVHPFATVSWTHSLVTGKQVIPGPGGDMECYVVQGWAWDPVTETDMYPSGTTYMHNDYGSAIMEMIMPGLLISGWEFRSLIWYCQDPPFPPWE